MEAIDDLKKAVAILLNECKHYQKRAFALNHALAVIMERSPEDRAALRKSHVEDLVSVGQQKADPIVESEALELYLALNRGTDVLPAVSNFVQHRKQS